MSYLVLARKWRPRTFEQLVGQEHVVRALSHALDSGRLHHAFLFTGTRGVGKTTIARIFAKSLNCERGQSSTPCGECGACVDIDAGRFDEAGGPSYQIWLQHLMDHLACAWHFSRMSDEQIAALTPDQFESITNAIPKLSGDHRLVEPWEEVP